MEFRNVEKYLENSLNKIYGYLPSQPNTVRLSETRRYIIILCLFLLDARIQIKKKTLTILVIAGIVGGDVAALCTIISVIVCVAIKRKRKRTYA